MSSISVVLEDSGEVMTSITDMVNDASESSQYTTATPRSHARENVSGGVACTPVTALPPTH